MTIRSHREALIFVVDDDKLHSTMLADYLREQDLGEIKIFNTGEECLKHIPEHPDVVVLDYLLNSTFKEAENGMQILEKIKERDYAVTVIMLAGHVSYGTAALSIAKGALNFVEKGKDSFEEVAEIIKAIELE